MTLIYGVATAAKSSGLVTVKVGSQVVSAQIFRDLTVAAGDPVAVDMMGSSYVVIGRLFTSATGSIDPGDSTDPAPAPAAKTGSTTFLPVQTASWRDEFGGWRTDNDDVYQGEFTSNGNHIGCWFYGSQVKSLVGATVTSAKLRVRRKNGGGAAAAQTVTLGHITEGKKPSGEPTFGGGATGPSLAWGKTNAAFDIGTTLGQSLVDGTYGGLGIHDADGSPYVILDGLSAYGGSGALTIEWVR